MAMSSAECYSLGTNRYTSRARIIFPDMSRGSSRAYKTGNTEAAVDYSGASFLLRFELRDSLARVVGTLARILWRGYSVSPIAFLVGL